MSSTSSDIVRVCLVTSFFVASRSRSKSVSSFRTDSKSLRKTNFKWSQTIQHANRLAAVSKPTATASSKHEKTVSRQGARSHGL